MGEAMTAGILQNGLATPGDILVSDVSPSRCQLLHERYGVGTTQSNPQAVNHGEVVVLAVKPQTLPQVMAELAGRFGPRQAVVSIVAGARVRTLAQGLRHPAVVRVMPNTPAQVGEGMSVWTATPEVSPQHREAVQGMLRALGQEIYVPDEHYIDMATAVSGSGPGYLFLFMESLMDAAVHIGLPRELAVPLVVQTVLGSARLAQSTGQHPAELRNLVTSPGGTTAEGLLQLEAGAFRALVTNAVMAAYERACHLGEEDDLSV